jgi:hypothetical protein
MPQAEALREGLRRSASRASSLKDEANVGTAGFEKLLRAQERFEVMRATEIAGVKPREPAPRCRR